MIEIQTARLAGTGTLSVVGGDGATGTGIPNLIAPNRGGAGSPGLVLYELPQDAGVPASFTVKATMGKTGDCALPQSPVLPRRIVLIGGCVDADGDGFTSTACGGNDCDDSDPAIHPDAGEVCNGKDNNCDGTIDTGAALCPVGSTCDVDHCAVVDAGFRPTEGGTFPDHADVVGGCDFQQAWESPRAVPFNRCAQPKRLFGGLRDVGACRCPRSLALASPSP